MNFSSKLIEDAVNAFASLPGIGKKTAFRLVLHLMNQEVSRSEEFSGAILKMRQNIKTCHICFNISDEETCGICNDRSRKKSTICVVENLRDLMAIEQTGQYHGQYHILGGVISPIEGISADDLNAEELLQRAKAEEVTEIIMALSPTIEGDTTIFYLSRQMRDCGVTISTIARGVSFGGELEYADELTLGRSIISRIPYEG